MFELIIGANRRGACEDLFPQNVGQVPPVQNLVIGTNIYTYVITYGEEGLNPPKKFSQFAPMELIIVYFYS